MLHRNMRDPATLAKQTMSMAKCAWSARPGLRLRGPELSHSSNGWQTLRVSLFGQARFVGTAALRAMKAEASLRADVFDRRAPGAIPRLFVDRFWL